MTRNASDFAALSRTHRVETMLKLPDVRQTDDYDCGDAAVDTVFQWWYGYKPARQRLSNSHQGMSPDTLEATLRACGLSVVSGPMRVGDLKHYTASGRPVVCLIQFDGVGHWVAVAGVVRGRVHFQDPVGGPRVLRAAEWEKLWHDTHGHGTVYRRWAVVAEPQGE